MESDPVESRIQSSGGKKRRPEGSGIRAKRYGVIPTYVFQQFEANGYVTRDELAERFKERSIVSAVRRMNQAGLIRRVMDKSRKVTYLPVESLPKVAPPSDIPKPVREWPKSQVYTEPRPIPTSVFDLARCL